MHIKNEMPNLWRRSVPQASAFQKDQQHAAAKNKYVLSVRAAFIGSHLALLTNSHQLMENAASTTM
jgi:hypothetical protein